MVVSGLPNITPIFMRIWLMKITEVMDLLMAGQFAQGLGHEPGLEPIWASPISPSISARGTSAATESTTSTSTAPLRTRISAMSRACSPESGWEMSRSSVYPQLAGIGHVQGVFGVDEGRHPARRWASAMTCRARVVLPEDSGP